MIAYYSRTGTTKAAAEALAEVMKNKGQDVELVQIKVDEGNEGYMYNAYLAFRGKSLDVQTGTVMIGKDAKEVWLCGPVHCWTLCSALKKYIEMNVDTLKAEGVTLNALATMGGSGDDGFKKAIEELTGKTVSHKIAFTTASVKDIEKVKQAFEEMFANDSKTTEETKTEESQ